MKKLTDRQRDERDLEALALLDAGMKQADVCELLSMSRGPLTRMLREIRLDEQRERAA